MTEAVTQEPASQSNGFCKLVNQIKEVSISQHQLNTNIDFSHHLKEEIAAPKDRNFIKQRAGVATRSKIQFELGMQASFQESEGLQSKFILVLPLYGLYSTLSMCMIEKGYRRNALLFNSKNQVSHMTSFMFGYIVFF